jgi:ribosomal protein S18 acetylase RimI-like enzyme
MDTHEINIIVRPLRKSDLIAALNMLGGLVTPDMACLNPEDQDSICFVAETEGRVVGFTLARELCVGIPLNKICVIQGIVIEEHYQHLGIGEKFIEAVFKHCANCKIEAVRILVDENDTSFQRFVEHLGFCRSMVANFDKIVESV